MVLHRKRHVYDGAEHGIDGQESGRGVVAFLLAGKPVTLLDNQVNLQVGGAVRGQEVVLRVQHFHVVACHDIRCRVDARPLHMQGQGGGTGRMGLEFDFAQVQDQLGRVLAQVGDGGELVVDVLNAYRRDGSPLQAGQKDAPQGHTQGRAIAAGKRLELKLAVLAGFVLSVQLGQNRVCNVRSPRWDARKAGLSVRCSTRQSTAH